MKTTNSFNSIMMKHSEGQQFKYLIVTADDFGYDTERDKGIIKSFNNGIVTRASLLVNGHTARTTAVKLAKDHGLPLGLHINLTEGRPVNRNSTTSLTCDGFFQGKFGFRKALSCGEISMAHIKDEVVSQMETFIEHVGYLPNHVDGHQHVHVLPEVRDTIAQVMNQFCLNQIRIPLETQLDGWFDGNCDFYNNVFEEARLAVGNYRRYNIRFPASFMGVSLMGKFMNVERIIETYERMNTNQQISVCEFMVHPGFPCVDNQGGCGQGPDEFACSPEREHELNILCDSKLKQMLKELNVECIS